MFLPKSSVAGYHVGVTSQANAAKVPPSTWSEPLRTPNRAESDVHRDETNITSPPPTTLAQAQSLILKPLSWLCATYLYTGSYSPEYYSYTSSYMHLSFLILPFSQVHSTTMHLHCFSHPSSYHSPHHMP